MEYEAELITDNKSEHAEGPIWDGERRCLFWVDLTGQKLFALDPATGALQSRSFPEPVCAVAPWSDGSLLVAFAKRLAWVNWPNGPTREIVPVEAGQLGNRCNDGKRDPAGRFWIGTMSADGSIPGAGALYRLETSGALTRVLEGLTIANGLGWSPDARTMYFIDSPTREVWAFDFATRDSSITRRRTVVRVPDGLGLPDGMTVDGEGMLWVAHWGAGCVCRWDPATGKVLAKITTGCPHTSSCAFGGEGSRELYITTSRLGLPASALATAPHSGGLYRHQVKPGTGSRRRA